MVWPVKPFVSILPSGLEISMLFQPNDQHCYCRRKRVKAYKKKLGLTGPKDKD